MKYLSDLLLDLEDALEAEREAADDTVEKVGELCDEWSDIEREENFE